MQNAFSSEGIKFVPLNPAEKDLPTNLIRDSAKQIAAVAPEIKKVNNVNIAIGLILCPEKQAPVKINIIQSIKDAPHMIAAIVPIFFLFMISTPLFFDFDLLGKRIEDSVL